MIYSKGLYGLRWVGLHKISFFFIIFFEEFVPKFSIVFDFKTNNWRFLIVIIFEVVKHLRARRGRHHNRLWRTSL